MTMSRRPLLLSLLKIAFILLPVFSVTANAEQNTAADKTKQKEVVIEFPVAKQRIYDQDLTKYSKADELAWLGDKDNRFLTLWSEQTTATPRGTSWLFPDTDTSANNPQFIQTLRYSLNEKGLNTYAISPLSQQMDPEISASLILGQLTELDAKFVNQGGKRLIIAQGNNAQLVLSVLVGNPDLTFDAFVMIGAHANSAEQMEMLAQNVIKLIIPVLDIYHEDDGLNVKNYAKSRLITATRGKKRNFRQRKIVGFKTSEMTKINTSQVIYGWLKSQGWY